MPKPVESDFTEDDEKLRAKLTGMNQTKKIDYLLQKSHFRSDKKVIFYVNKTLKRLNLPQIPFEKILERNKWNRPKNNFREMGEKHYEEPVFSNHYFGFQIDLIDQSRYAKDNFTTPELIDGKLKDGELIHEELSTPQEKEIFPPYIFITQNVNTKYVRAICTTGKTAEDMLECFKLFYEATNHKLASVVSDAEAGIDSEIVRDWCHEHKVSLKIIPAEIHTAHAVIDRLIRTLRDMNTVEEKSKEQSDHPKYRDFSVYRLKKFIGLYNNNRHSSTHHTPKEMDENRKWEEDWIVKKLYERERRRKIVNFELYDGDMVRIINPSYGKLGKKRYTVTPEKYSVKKHKGHQYFIMAEDGSTKVIPRWRLLHIAENSKHKLAKTIGKSDTGLAKEILAYKNKKYTVDWHVPNGAKQQITKTSIVDLRTDSGKMTKEERKFWEGKTIPKAVQKGLS